MYINNSIYIFYINTILFDIKKNARQTYHVHIIFLLYLSELETNLFLCIVYIYINFN